MIYTLHREQIVPASPERVWAYFATPRNLNEMTPPDMDFEFVQGGDEPMYAGQVIAYKVAILPSVRVRWLTQITHVESGRRFIDEQRAGPYRLWIHEHHFEPNSRGRAYDRPSHLRSALWSIWRSGPQTLYSPSARANLRLPS